MTAWPLLIWTGPRQQRQVSAAKKSSQGSVPN